MKKTSLFKHLGIQTMLITLLAMLITVTMIVTVSLLMFRQYSNSIIVERARVGMAVLRDNLSYETSLLPETHAGWMGREEMAALLSGDSEPLTKAWMNADSKAGAFLAVTDQSGNLIFQSDGYPLASFRLDEAAAGKTLNGIASAGDAMAALYAAPYSINGRSGAIAVGFDMSESAWMEKVKEICSCDVTVFKSNVRYATTIKDPATGKPVVGTDMADNIRSVVLDSQQPFEGQATIFSTPYFVSYYPMYDVNNQVCGAYFSGSNAIEVNRELTRVVRIAVALSAAALAATSVVLFWFIRRRVSIPIREPGSWRMRWPGES